MNLLKGLKTETMEALAELWVDKNFKTLVKCLRDSQDKCAKHCLTRNSWDEVIRLQGEVRAYSLVIKTVEQAHNKVNKK